MKRLFLPTACALCVAGCGGHGAISARPYSTSAVVDAFKHSGINLEKSPDNSVAGRTTDLEGTYDKSFQVEVSVFVSPSAANGRSSWFVFGNGVPSFVNAKNVEIMYLGPAAPVTAALRMLRESP